MIKENVLKKEELILSDEVKLNKKAKKELKIDFDELIDKMYKICRTIDCDVCPFKFNKYDKDCALSVIEGNVKTVTDFLNL